MVHRDRKKLKTKSYNVLLIRTGRTECHPCIRRGLLGSEESSISPPSVLDILHFLRPALDRSGDI